MLATTHSSPVSIVVLRKLAPFHSSRNTSNHGLPLPALLSTLLMVAMMVFGAPAFAAELHLRNGDRVTGELVTRTDGKIHFRSPLLGDLVISELDATVIESVEVPVESLSGLPPSSPKSVAKPAQTPARTKAPNAIDSSSSAPQIGASPTTSGGEKTPPAIAAKTPASGGSAKGKPEPAAKLGRWRGKVELGFQQQSGRQDGLTASLRADAERERGRNQVKANVRYLYGELNDRINTDRTDASVRWRHQLSARVFAQSLTSFLTDDVKQIDQNFEQNLGFGYALLKRDRHVINVGGGATGQYRQAVNIDNGMAILGEVFQDYTYRINGRITLVQDLLAQYSPVTKDQYILRNGSLVAATGDVQNYKIRFNSTLQGRVTDKVSMNIRFEYEFDNTIADREAKADQRISSSFGYAF